MTGTIHPSRAAADTGGMAERTYQARSDATIRRLADQNHIGGERAEQLVGGWEAEAAMPMTLRRGTTCRIGTKVRGYCEDAVGLAGGPDEPGVALPPLVMIKLATTSTTTAMPTTMLHLGIRAGGPL